MPDEEELTDPTVTEREDVERGVVRSVEQEMQRYWDNWCADTGCVPAEFSIHGPRTTRVSADFRDGGLADAAAEAALAAVDYEGLKEENERLRGLQESIHADSKRRWADMDIESEAMALAEEGFEALAAVFRAVVKRRHGTRGSHADWTAKLRQELAQVGAVLFNMAAIEGFDFLDAVIAEHERWVLTDTNHDPVAAASQKGSSDEG